MKLKKIVAAVVGMSASVSASATILTFDGPTFNTTSTIAPSYGNNVTASSDTVGNYLQGNGFTPNITTSYLTPGLPDVPATNTQVGFSRPDTGLYWWDTQYGDLSGVVYSAYDVGFAEITLTPTTDWGVQLNSFDMAGYPDSNVLIDSLVILDSSGGILWDAGVNTIRGAGTHDTFSPGISSEGSITLRWGANWNAGLDNLNFDQFALLPPMNGNTTAIPAPTSFTLLVLGLMGLRLSRRNT